ncbi:hypothetical protein XELAEV_18046524mg [Xenopus laevis]|uniref:Uncharacterized protein n=1 Tax=Xenopus laevis TaxID=8355 RepID=A0A974H0N7_XENLA|nr:hypothetical protein XELAEV_18046524mg [Xenopus laevis]
MASDGKNRMQLACKYCMKITDRLSGHLRKVCRKGAGEAEIVALVEESRAKMRMLVRNLSVVHYKQLKAGADSDRSLNFFVNFLESNGCLVCEKPSHTDTERTSAEEVENPVQDAVEEEEDTCEEEMDTEHPFLMLSTSASKMSTKKIMEEAGLHRKHTSNSPLLQGFRSYLEKKYAKSGIKHEYFFNTALLVDNVSRWLHFVNPNEPSTSCIHNIERSMEFFREIGASAASRATARNYMSGVKKCIAYVTSEDQLLEEDPSLRGSIQKFLKSITEVQKSICRGASKENSVGRRCTNPRECQEVLKLANHYFAEIIDRANTRTELQERDMTSVLFYLEALLILQHLQRPSVIQHMTVQQWLERKRYQSRSKDSARAAVIKVKDGAQHVVVLNEVEEMWFDTYFRFIRPTFIKRITNGDKGYFFVSSKGSKIQNPTTDVHRFQERFNACLSTGKEALQIFEKFIICESSLEDQELLKIYLRADFEAIESNHTQDGQVSGKFKEKSSEKEISYKKIENMFKVELDSKGPTLKQCREVPEMHGKYCFDRWRRQQTKCRMDAVIGKYHTCIFCVVF